MGKTNVIQVIAGALIVAASVAIPGTQGWLTTLGVSLIAGGVAGGAASLLSSRQSSSLANPISSEYALPVVYGTTRLGFAYTDIKRDPSDKDILYVVGAICMGPVDSITKIFFDDTVVVDTPVCTGALSTTNVISKYSGNRLKYAIHLGSHSSAVDAEMHSRFPTEWPTTSKGAAVCYIVLRLKYDKDVFTTFPNMTVMVKGRTLFDPRDSSTAYSENPALALRDYLTDPIYGGGADASEIDDNTVEDAANYCEETVNTTAYVGPRFTCNGLVDTSQGRLQNLAELRTACRGVPVYQSGKFRLLINHAETPSAFELNEDNIIGDWEIRRLGNVPNSVTATFVDPTQQYQTKEISWPEAAQSNGFLTDDNGIPRVARFDLPFTQHGHISQQIGMVSLREAREDLVVSVTAKQEALKLQYGEVVNLRHSTLGGTLIPFRVGPIVIIADATVRLTLFGYSDDVYSLDEQNTLDIPPATSLPNPFTCAAPTGLALTSDATTALETQDGSYVPRIHAEWTAAAEPFLDHYEAHYKVTGDPAWTPLPNIQRTDTSIEITPVTNTENYTFEVRAVNTLGVPSAWVSGTVTVSTEPGSASGAPTFFVDVGTDDFTITLEDALNLIALEYQLKGSGGYGGTWLNAWDAATGTIGMSATIVRTKGVTRLPGFNVGAKWRMQYLDSNGNTRTYGTPITFDQLGTAHITGDGIAFDSSGHPLIRLFGDVYATDMYFTGATGTDPGTPTTSSNHITGRTGSLLLSGVTVAEGDEYWIRSVAKDVASNLGPVSDITKVRRSIETTVHRPTLTLKIRQTSATTAVATLTVYDPDLLVTANPYYRTRVNGGDWDSSDQTSWDASTGTAGSSTTLVRSKNLTIGAEHDTFINCWVSDALDGGVPQIASDSCDADRIPKVLSCGIDFDPTTGEVTPAPHSDEDTDDQYVLVGIGSDPGTPTTSDLHVAGNEGSVASGVFAAEGEKAIVNVVGHNSGGYGAVRQFFATRPGGSSGSSVSSVDLLSIEFNNYPGGFLEFLWSFSATLASGDYAVATVTETYDDDTFADYPKVGTSGAHDTTYYKDPPGRPVTFSLRVDIYNSSDVLIVNRETKGTTIYQLEGFT